MPHALHDERRGPARRELVEPRPDPLELVVPVEQLSHVPTLMRFRVRDQGVPLMLRDRCGERLRRMITTASTVIRELAARTADGITVFLLWRPGERDVLLRVDDARTGVRFELPVPGRDALEAFNHPFAYAA